MKEIIETIKKKLMSIEEGILYMEETDTAWHRDYEILLKERRVLKKVLKKLEKFYALRKKWEVRK